MPLSPSDSSLKRNKDKRKSYVQVRLIPFNIYFYIYIERERESKGNRHGIEERRKNTLMKYRQPGTAEYHLPLHPLSLYNKSR
tara:strand:+ start:1519 stop:1767 length:249 start_codon:yes stop_codon:yes gene_type:complete